MATLYSVLEIPEILGHLTAFWPKQLLDTWEGGERRGESLFYKDITVITYELRAKWIVQRCELLHWNPEWVRWKAGPWAGLRIVLGEGRPAMSEAELRRYKGPRRPNVDAAWQG